MPRSISVRAVVGLPNHVAAIVVALLGISNTRVDAQQLRTSREHDSIRAAAIDSLSSHRKTIALPVLGSAPETGFQYGATTFITRDAPLIFHARPASLTVFAIGTMQHQSQFGSEFDYWSRENRWRVSGAASWQRYPLPFYGIGRNTPDSAREQFTQRGPQLSATLQRRVTRSTYVLLGARYAYQPIVESDTNGVLHNDAIYGSKGGTTSQLTVGVIADSRDNLFAPEHGHFIQTTWSQATRTIGSDFDFGRVRVDGRQYIALSDKHVIAMHAQVQGINGRAPFDQLALIGGSDIMRGYARGRYRDQWLAAAQIEYRAHIAGPLRGVVFGGAGTISHKLSALSAFESPLPTYGAGVRWRLDQKQRTAIRVDYGRGRGGASGLYVGFGEAF